MGEQFVDAIDALRLAAARVAYLAAGGGVEGLVPATAARAVGVLGDVERLLAPVRMECGVVAAVDPTVWGGDGSASPAEWLARQRGVETGAATGELEAGRRLASQPEVRDAARRGGLSGQQLIAVTAAVEADPGSAATLLEDVAAGESLARLKERCRDIRQKATPVEHLEFKRWKQRSARLKIDDEGAMSFRMSGPAADRARVESVLGPLVEQFFLEDHRSGQRRTFAARLFDATLTALGVPLIVPPEPEPEPGVGPAGGDADDERGGGGGGGGPVGPRPAPPSPKGVPARPTGDPIVTEPSQEQLPLLPLQASPTPEQPFDDDSLVGHGETGPVGHGDAGVGHDDGGVGRRTEPGCDAASSTGDVAGPAFEPDGDPCVAAGIGSTDDPDATGPPPTAVAGHAEPGADGELRPAPNDSADVGTQAEPGAVNGAGPRDRPATGGPGRLVGTVRVSYRALLRGRCEPGEVCDWNGSDPLPVQAARTLLPGAFLSVVVTDEDGRVCAVARLGRAVSRKDGAWEWVLGGRPPSGSAAHRGTPMEWLVQIEASALERVRAGDGSFLGTVGRKAEPVASLTGPHRCFRGAQLTVLNWTQPTCAATGCNRTVCTQNDHRVDYVLDPVSDVDNADRLCPHHHRLKSHHGYRLAPGRGRRPLLAPPPGWQRAANHRTPRSPSEPPVRQSANRSVEQPLDQPVTPPPDPSLTPPAGQSGRQKQKRSRARRTGTKGPAP